jgi:hypothetical protein
MEFIFLIAGIIIGIVTMLIRDRFTKAHGFLEIDPEKQLCNVVVSSEEVSRRRCKKAILKIVHNVDISQDIQGL